MVFNFFHPVGDIYSLIKMSYGTSQSVLLLKFKYLDVEAGRIIGMVYTGLNQGFRIVLGSNLAGLQ